MRAVLTRVRSASVTIDGKVNGAIGRGYLVLLGVGHNDTEETALKLADKVCNLRIFRDENDKMNLNLEQVGGSILVISQFTLYADTSSRRPGFTGAAKPDPKMLRLGMEQAGVSDVRRALMLGDSLSSDIAAAANAGVDA